MLNILTLISDGQIANMSLIGLIALLPLLYLGGRYLLILITPFGLPGIPCYPDPVPVLGDLPRLIRSIKANHGFRVFFDGVARDLGPIAQVRVGFGKTLVILSDYQESESLYQRHADFDRAEQTTEIFDQIIPTGQISQPTNAMFKHHRRLIGLAMTSKYLNMTMPRANEAVDELVELIGTKVDMEAGKVWSVEEDMTAATMDVICGMAFGDSWGIVREFTRQIQEGSSSIGPLGESVFNRKMPQLALSTIALLDSVPIGVTFPRLHKFRNSISPAYNCHYNLVFGYLAGKLAKAREKALALSESAVELADNTLDVMVAREARGDTMSDAEMKDEIFLYLVAGTETSSVTMSWCLKFFTNNPSVQIKLRQHLLDRLPQPITAESLSATNVPYLEAVVYEALRLSRTAGGASRQAKKDTVILGHVIPKGTNVVVTSAFHFETEDLPAWGGGPEVVARTDNLRSGEARKVGYWKAGSGKVFDPERWLKDGEFDANAGPSLPFAGGQRGCFGRNLALLEMRLLVAKLNMAFYFAPVEEKYNSMELHETVTGHPRQSFIKPERWS